MTCLTATLIAQNEEVDLPRALASVQGIADEIIVVDAGSTDRTVEIARQFGARVLTRALTNFGDQKNFAASQAANDWILSVDSDEELSAEMRASILAWKEQTPDKVGYQFCRKSQYLGAWILHSGWYPEYWVRLYRRDAGRFEGVPHDAVKTRGPVGRLEGHLHHYTMRNFREHAAKVDAFSTIAAEDLFSRGRRSWTGAMLFAPPWAFFRNLLLKMGILDGYRGFLISWMSARYVRLKFWKLGVLARGGQLTHREWPRPGQG